jgi:hypothetical protein
MGTRAQLILAILPALLLTSPARAQESPQSFSDFPPTHPAYQAVEYLKSQGIISGYPDGTFQPDRKVNRAEAAKIIVATLASQEELAAETVTPFNDVPAGVWYLPYVELARRTYGIIDGPPKRPAFEGERPVLKVEFLKMWLLASKADVFGSLSDITLPLSGDVTNVNEWYYPYMRYAVTSSMTMIGADGTLAPGRELTRGEVALLLYRSLMYKDGRRTQALLSEAESEIIAILGYLDENNFTEAEYASARGLLAARGANASRPDVPIVQGALKVTEAFHELVKGYRAGVSRDFETAIALSGKAWNLAEEAKSKDTSLSALAAQLQDAAHTMAESARGLQE